MISLTTLTTRTTRSLLLLVALSFAACGGAGPAGPSTLRAPEPQGSTTLRGIVLGGVSGSAAGFSSQAVDDPILVSVVEDPSIQTTVGADGSFVLRGLPEGGFTLLFTQGGATLGTLSFSGLAPNQEIEITVEVVDGTVVLLEERRNGIGHGDIELEGDVELVLQLDPAGDSWFLIAGRTVLVQPGVTAIREGNRARDVDDVTEGTRVHVKGVWLPPDGTATEQPVLAYEIKLQGVQDDDDEPGEKLTICHKKKNTLSISASAWPAHQAHGDTLGACTSAGG